MPIPRVAPRMPQNSESCSENGLFTPRAFFSKLGWLPGFWSIAPGDHNVVYQLAEESVVHRTL